MSGFTFRREPLKFGVRTNSLASLQLLAKKVQAYGFEPQQRVDEEVDYMISFLEAKRRATEGQRDYNLLYFGSSRVGRSLNPAIALKNFDSEFLMLTFPRNRRAFILFGQLLQSGEEYFLQLASKEEPEPDWIVIDDTGRFFNLPQGRISGIFIPGNPSKSPAEYCARVISCCKSLAAYFIEAVSTLCENIPQKDKADFQNLTPLPRLRPATGTTAPTTP